MRVVEREESEEQSFFLIKQREMASGQVAVLGRSGGVEAHQRKRLDDRTSYPQYFRKRKGQTNKRAQL
jgi:hypothetical protein